ncbi:MAG: T9SS type A sorting domain-containing protein [Flavobacteriales bacterium]|nr:T9SS type A sorting domain-containing protein [Flavobacteriales bacterium]
MFDIQDDASVDYSYDMQANDLFFTSSGFMTSNHGYPHIANVSYKTPFHAVYASPLNTFHIQNPEIEMSEFISDEVSGSNKYIQNRHFAGHLNQPYSAVFETIDSVLIGSNVTERKSFGTVEVGPMSEVVISSSRSIIKSGFKTELGGRFIVHSENIDEISCFDFEVFNTMDKKLSSDVNNDSYTNKNGSFDNFDVYPNPTQELIHVTLPQITGVYNVRLMNLAGGEIMRLSNINSELDINLKGLPQGLYLLEAKDENEVSYNCKIVKQ